MVCSSWDFISLVHVCFFDARLFLIHFLCIIRVGIAKATRDEKRRKLAEEEALAEEAKKKKEEEEERKRSLENIRQETGKKREGMVWNKTAREWQELPDVTEESWRD
jgi:hypothetical protein